MNIVEDEYYRLLGRTDLERADAVKALAEKSAEIARLTAERDEARSEITSLIDRLPDVLRKLGRFLAAALDEDQFKTAERMLLGGIAHYDALLAERAGVSEAMVGKWRTGIEPDEFKGTIYDETGKSIGEFWHSANARACVEAYNAALEDALATPIPTPVNREAIRAEAKA